MVTMTMKITSPLFLHDTLVYADVTSYQVWLQKVQHLEKQLNIFNLCCSKQQSDIFTGHFGIYIYIYIYIYIMICHSTKFGYKRIISSEDLMLLVDIF